MSLGLEYLQRKGVLKEMISYPFSLYLTNEITHEKVVLCLSRQNANYRVRKWLVSQTQEDQQLPPMEECLTPELFGEETVLSGYQLITCRHQAIPSRENSYSHPMPKSRYNYYFNNYLTDFDRHKIAKDRWLWTAFASVYRPELIVYGMSVKRSLNFYNSYGDNEIIQDQKTIVETHYPQDWRRWKLWCGYLLNVQKELWETETPPEIPGEFLFKHAYLIRDSE
jgi:hypothetical protein